MRRPSATRYHAVQRREGEPTLRAPNLRVGRLHLQPLAGKAAHEDCTIDAHEELCDDAHGVNNLHQGQHIPFEEFHPGAEACDARLPRAFVCGKNENYRGRVATAFLYAIIMV